MKITKATIITSISWFLISVMALLHLCGCANTKVSTPPWSTQDIEKLKALEVKTTPLCLVEID